jgi:hypothetical protein
MEPPGFLMERRLPDFILATAAFGVFVLLGTVVLISILFENSCTHAPRSVGRTLTK